MLKGANNERLKKEQRKMTKNGLNTKTKEHYRTKDPSRNGMKGHSLKNIFVPFLLKVDHHIILSHMVYILLGGRCCVIYMNYKSFFWRFFGGIKGDVSEKISEGMRIKGFQHPGIYLNHMFSL